MSIIIRPARDEDLDAVLVLHVASIRTLCAIFYSPEQIEAWAGPKRRDDYDRVVRAGTMFVAVDGNRVIGFGTLNPKKTKITGMYVDPGAIGRGTGRLLMPRLEQLARDGGMTILLTDSTLNAVPFYLKMGFTKTGDITHTMPGGIEVEAVCMEKRL